MHCIASNKGYVLSVQKPIVAGCCKTFVHKMFVPPFLSRCLSLSSRVSSSSRAITIRAMADRPVRNRKAPDGHSEADHPKAQSNGSPVFHPAEVAEGEVGEGGTG